MEAIVKLISGSCLLINFDEFFYIRYYYSTRGHDVKLYNSHCKRDTCRIFFLLSVLQISGTRCHHAKMSHRQSRLKTLFVVVKVTFLVFFGCAT